MLIFKIININGILSNYKKKELAVVLSNLGKNIKIGYLHVSILQ